MYMYVIHIDTCVYAYMSIYFCACMYRLKENTNNWSNTFTSNKISEIDGFSNRNTWKYYFYVGFFKQCMHRPIGNFCSNLMAGVIFVMSDLIQRRELLEWASDQSGVEETKFRLQCKHLRRRFCTELSSSSQLYSLTALLWVMCVCGCSQGASCQCESLVDQ